MSDITFSCPHCSQHIAIDEAGAGLQVTCPTCNAPLSVPTRLSAQQGNLPPGANKHGKLSPAEMRDIIWSVVSPIQTVAQDGKEIFALGSDCIPVVIDVFLHPRDPIIGTACDQGILAWVLEVFAAKGNHEAAAFLHRIAKDEVDLFDAGGQTAYDIAKRFAAAKVAESPTTPAVSPSAASSSPTSTVQPCNPFDDVLREVETRMASEPNTNTPGWVMHRVLLGFLQLIRNGGHVDTRDSFGTTPLMIAALVGMESAVRLLIQKGANVNAANTSRDTPLMFAARGGSEPVVRLLLQVGANNNARNSNGDMAMIWAEREGHAHIVELLRTCSQVITSSGPLTEPKPPLSQTGSPGTMIGNLREAESKSQNMDPLIVKAVKYYSRLFAWVAVIVSPIFFFGGCVETALIAFPDKVMQAHVTSCSLEPGGEKLPDTDIVTTRFQYGVGATQYTDVEVLFFRGQRKHEARGVVARYRKLQESKEPIDCYVPRWGWFSGSASLVRPQRHGRNAILALLGAPLLFCVGAAVLWKVKRPEPVLRHFLR